MDKDVKSNNNGNKSGENGQETLVDLVAIIKARIAILVERRQNLMAEIVPVDAAIYELEQLLASYGGYVGYGVESKDDPETMAKWMDMGDAPSTPYYNSVVEEDPEAVVTVPSPKPMSRTPVLRTGPMEDPPIAKDGGVGVETMGYVRSPGGAPIPTNAQLLRQAVQQRGQG